MFKPYDTKDSNGAPCIRYHFQIKLNPVFLEANPMGFGAEGVEYGNEAWKALISTLQIGLKFLELLEKYPGMKKACDPDFRCKVKGANCSTFKLTQNRKKRKRLAYELGSNSKSYTQWDVLPMLCYVPIVVTMWAALSHYIGLVVGFGSLLCSIRYVVILKSANSMPGKNIYGFYGVSTRLYTLPYRISQSILRHLTWGEPIPKTFCWYILTETSLSDILWINKVYERIKSNYSMFSVFPEVGLTFEYNGKTRHDTEIFFFESSLSPESKVIRDLTWKMVRLTESQPAYNYMPVRYEGFQANCGR